MQFECLRLCADGINASQICGNEPSMVFASTHKYLCSDPNGLLLDAGVTDRLSARLQTARIGFDSRPRPYEDPKYNDWRQRELPAYS